MSRRSTPLECAGHWFLRSGIQESTGGVARYYRSDLGTNARVSTEITGYAVSTFLFLHERTGDASYREAALNAARFLMSTAWDRRLNAFPFEHSLNGDQPAPLAYFFDFGIIVRGLLAAWRVSGDVEFRDVAVAAGRAMLADFRATEAIHPILALPEKRPLPYEPRWSASPGCYQLKSAMAWHDLYEATEESQFREAYEEAVESAVASERDFLPGSADQEKVMDRLHAYGYFLEGLLPVLHLPMCERAFRNGLDRVSAYLRDIAPVFARSDVYAQLLRMRIFGARFGGIPLDQDAAAHEASQAAGFQLTSTDPRIDGGYAFGRKAGSVLPFVNPVSTAFCLQALALWADQRNNDFRTNRRELI